MVRFETNPPAWVCQQLAPCLREGDIAIIDNLATHKISGVRQAIESAGASLLYLPVYSPDFNPIEPMWGKIKACMCGLGPRTEEELFAAIVHAIETVTPSDCKGFFKYQIRYIIYENAIILTPRASQAH